MNYWAVVLFSFVCYLLHCGSIEGRVKKLSSNEELEIEKELKRLNKPPLKTVKSKYGDVYDCIDFYKQPAFDHPLWKNHTYEYDYDSQMKEISFPASEIGRLPDGGCPIGTVPIRRTTKEDLMRTKYPQDELYTTAIVRTKSGVKYKGAKTMISIYNPSVSESQMSLARMTLRNGEDSIEVGWMVYPWLYGDNLTRFYIYYQSGSTTCFNTRCPGFVIVNTHFLLDGAFTNISKRDTGPFYEITVFVYREEASGNWWLAVGDNLDKVGYWPKKLFSGLQQDLALSVEWGGTTHWDKKETESPGMGSSARVEGDPRLDAFCAHIKIVNEANEFDDVGDTDEEYLYPAIYKARDLKISRNLERVVVFGGPGFGH